MRPGVAHDELESDIFGAFELLQGSGQFVFVSAFLLLFFFLVFILVLVFLGFALLGLGLGFFVFFLSLGFVLRDVLMLGFGSGNEFGDVLGQFFVGGGFLRFLDGQIELLDFGNALEETLL